MALDFFGGEDTFDPDTLPDPESWEDEDEVARKPISEEEQEDDSLENLR